MAQRRSYMTRINPRPGNRAMIQPSRPPAEPPRSEPEIFPPGHVDERPGGTAQAYFRVHGVRQVYVGNLGPFGIILLALVVAAVTAVILIVLLGAVLIWIPVVAMLV